MDDDKGLKRKGRERIIPKFSDAGRIIVTGYDTGLPLDDVATALKNHFSRCGMITDVSIPLDSAKNYKILQRCGYIYFVGEGAVDKALQLNGSDMGGRNVSVEAYPYDEDANDMVLVRVEGYDTSLSKTDLKTALSDHFSSYGYLKEFYIIEGSAGAMIYGKDVADKVTELNGSHMGGHKLAVRVTAKPRIPTVHRRQHRQRPPPTLPALPEYQ
ncbi:nucleolin 2 isoform X2 [Arabidopsis lyrata subsp. lyrata]|uniref:nucleolin 2 isoform X2 n=1 Tax=Arabidopsis lyrata subsp. lyrata TaxID=81972 RepID=UPI000A29D270|nr:nucleolin 2 isoform X2 [Arabidopsis lyrata subsp. lyrata]|eukprot:XP_020876031.1 nucleolin 2 isoform X2 [Arabidopsis lyrata subsp. lyrata]